MGARHGWWCGARTYPLTCKRCGDDVFHFGCDCGCSVLFEELGPPWPLHRCYGYAPRPTLSRLGEDLSDSLLRYLNDDNAAALSRLIESNIESDYTDSIKEAATSVDRSKTGSAWITKQEPYHGCLATEQGVVTELIRNSNIRKKSGVEDVTPGVALLGKFARAPVCQITIHTGALADDESENCSFTFFVDEALVTQNDIFKGCLVVAELRGISASSRHPIWVCDQLAELS